MKTLRVEISKKTVWVVMLSLLSIFPISKSFSTTTCTVSTSTISGVRVDSITSLAACTYDIPSGFNNVSLVVVGGGGSGATDAGSGGGGGGNSCQNDTATASNNTGAGCGGAPRTIFFQGDSNATPTSSSSNQSSLGGGGNGGEGLYSNIGSFAGIYSAYSCGGGGGINSNLGGTHTPTIVWGAGGKAGCYSAGKGSNKSTRYNNASANSSTRTNDFNGSSGVDGFGGGGGGTDPEDMVAGRGGDGVVILRFSLPDPRCPNDHSDATVTPPVACIAKIHITAGDTAVSTKPS